MPRRTGRGGSVRTTPFALLFVMGWSISACSDDPPLPPGAVAPVTSRRPPMSGSALMRALACGSCHADLPPADSPGPPLDAFAASDADRVIGRLRPTGSHPDFHLDDREVVVLSRYLGVDPTRSTSDPIQRAARDVDGHTAADGERLFSVLNCSGCHAGRDRAAVHNGPVLALEGERVQLGWLREFLRSPRAIRPFGVRPGDGGRMPRFDLSDAEIDSIVSTLSRQTGSVPAFSPASLSEHSRTRTRRLITTRYSCLGCHRLDGEGGRMGPDLSDAGRRLRPGFIRAMLDRPAHVVPSTLMPPTPAPATALDELASMLAAQVDSVPVSDERAGYLSPLDHATLFMTGEGAADRYAMLCGACHGGGAGDGYNAAFLRTTPADHTDAAAMSERTDARLFNAIAGGARFLDGSPEMPAFPQLEASEIRSLVAYIRSLCSCAQPAWAGDGNGVDR